ncbi:Jid1p Ecym_3476 [Eremothecium cymbalariae DBVPG|uniref:J domain-containing protein n=1 Tax=Eremothecium cymbalariae (strain CBS 270.75 / DBVPG 7215 / KCTC 17166 / NRRL Y-17582) TaxID=931890 RepID=G8JS40_ERECY|nr:Hypothetical protein Ecym_3476 [Eremothecium cymbalariae DBVPG\
MWYLRVSPLYNHEVTLLLSNRWRISHTWPGCRNYAITEMNVPPPCDREGHRWPTSEYPSPYEVLGLQKGLISFDKLKKQYHRLAKLYHPDISENVVIFSKSQGTSAGKVPSSQLIPLDKNEKLYRFKLINEAYALLSDRSRKEMYDVYKTGWEYGPKRPPMTMTHQTYHGNPTYYNAGTWQDFSDQSNNEPAPKISPWSVLLWIGALAICIEATAFLSKLEDGLHKRYFTQDETERDLALAQLNYGLNTDKWSRLRRFLWFRTWGLYRDQADLDRQAVENEKLLKKLQEKT